MRNLIIGVLVGLLLGLIGTMFSQISGDDDQAALAKARLKWGDSARIVKVWGSGRYTQRFVGFAHPFGVGRMPTSSLGIIAAGHDVTGSWQKAFDEMDRIEKERQSGE